MKSLEELLFYYDGVGMGARATSRLLFPLGKVRHLSPSASARLPLSVQSGEKGSAIEARCPSHRFLLGGAVSETILINNRGVRWLFDYRNCIIALQHPSKPKQGLRPNI